MIFDTAARPSPHLLALPPGRPFFDDLVAALLADFGERPDLLTGVRIFVPSRRSVRALKEAFARQAPSGVMLLPRIAATADVSEDDPLILARGTPADLPQAPSAVAKRLKIAGIYQAALAEREEFIPWHAALRAASELVRVSDLLSEYGVKSQDIEGLAELPALEAGAAHWREVSSLLALVSERYPAWLQSEGLVDPRERRAGLLRQLADGLEADETTPLIIAAGFLGTSPSSQAFLKRVAGLPNGAVVLPGFDSTMSDTAWEQIEAPHPQASFKELLAEGFEGLDRTGVTMIPYTERVTATARRELLSLALTPAEATSDWGAELETFTERHGADKALDGLRYAVARTSEEEADFIALSLREILETPDKTAAFVTADRDLARRVAGKLQGWNIEIDDSGGAPIRGSYRATFLRLIAQIMAEPSDPGALAGLVHHQLFGLGLSAEERRPLVQAFDRFLRGRKPRQGWEGLRRSLGDEWRPTGSKEDQERACELLRRLQRAFRSHLPDAEGSVHTLLEAHLGIARALASTDREEGAERLFRFEDGEVLEPHIAALLERPELLGETQIKHYAKVFDSLLEGPAFRPPGGQHPRLALYGILEARLQHADHFIVGGLQEGIWPGDAALDPFLSRAMRKALSLPEPEVDIGRVAHDFSDFASRPSVLLTRSARRGATPARASRLMLRLESFLTKLDPGGSRNAAPRLRQWREERFGHNGPARRALPPEPAPPVGHRPTKLSVTDVAKWLRDPYAIYAKHILKLRTLPRYDEPFGANHRGTLIHDWLENVIKLKIDDPSIDCGEELDQLLPECLEKADMPEEQQVLNARFIDRARQSFLSFEKAAQEVSVPSGVEAEGRLEWRCGERKVLIRGKADRIDEMHEGGVHIIDYKLGGSTSVAQGQTFSPQLFLLALMMERGGFSSSAATPVQQVSYLPLNGPIDLFGSKDESKKHLRGAALREALKLQEERFTSWLDEQYRDGQTFPSQLYPFRTDIVGDYDDLARRSEWQSGGEDD